MRHAVKYETRVHSWQW